MARTGKIASLPAALREALNERLHEGQLAPQILPWINAAPGVREALAQRWPDLPEITDGNLSEWRSGGFRDWLADQKVRALAQLVDRMADAAGQPPESLLRKVWTGKILENMETLCALDDGAALLTGASQVASLSAASLRETEHKDRTRQKDEDIALRKITIARKFVAFLDDAEARRLAENARSDDAQLPLLADYLMGTPDLNKLKRS